MVRKKQPLMEKSGSSSSRRNQCARIAYMLAPCALFLSAIYLLAPNRFTTSTALPSSSAPRGRSSSLEHMDDWEGKDSTFASFFHVRESVSTPSGAKRSSIQECDIFDGKWVRDSRKPFYPPGSCPYVDAMFDCFQNQRPDDGYLYWRWQPNHCDIPRMNATDFLERLRGQRLVLVGDSLNRNMFESLICILRNGVPDKSKVFEITRATNLKAKPYSCVKFTDYNCSVEFIRANYLVKLNQTRGQQDYKVILDQIEDSASIYRDADILIFNTGRWWGHVKTWNNVFQEGDRVYEKLKIMDACERAMTTWARWVEANIDPARTQVFYRGYSPSHFSGGLWNSGGKCHQEKEPIYNETFLKRYPDYSILAENILKGMKIPTTFLNVSRLAAYRKDGHTSIYRMTYKDEQEKAAAVEHQDCAHWCLPGVPDIWNELLYASLLKNGRGPWRSRGA